MIVEVPIGLTWFDPGRQVTVANRGVQTSGNLRASDASLGAVRDRWLEALGGLSIARGIGLTHILRMPHRESPSADTQESPRSGGPDPASEAVAAASDAMVAAGGSAAVSYRLYRTVAVVRASGRYTPTELAEAVGAVLDDAATRPLRGIVLDMRDSQSFAERSQTDVEQLTQYMGRRCDGFGGRVAVIPSAHAPGQLVRLVSGCFADRGVDAHIFREPAKAVQWLRKPAIDTSAAALAAEDNDALTTARSQAPTDSAGRRFRTLNRQTRSVASGVGGGGRGSPVRFLGEPAAPLLYRYINS